MKLLHDSTSAVNLVPLVLAVIIAFCILFIGAYVNGTIQVELKDTIGDPGGAFVNTTENKVIARLNNTSFNWDSALDIVQVVIIISILAAAIGAIFLFTRFGT